MDPGSLSDAQVNVTTPGVSVPQAFALGSELHHRLLAWINDSEDMTSRGMAPRFTTDGLAAHLTDDRYTVIPVRDRESDAPLADGGIYGPEVVGALLSDLEAAGLVQVAPDGRVARTSEGDKMLGGIVYADHPELADDPEHAAYFQAEPEVAEPE